MIRATCLLASCALIALLLFVPASAYPSPSNYYRYDEPYEAEEFLNALNRINSILQLERKMESYKDEMNSYKDEITSEKRGFDLGLGRGFSGTLQAKHLLAVAAANSAGGPGRRRRDAH